MEERVTVKFVILGTDGPEGAAKRPLYRQAHLQRLEQWAQQGKVILAGPLADKTGSLIVVEAESLEEVQTFSQGDPYMINGVFQEITVHPFMQIFPRELESEKT
jgi:hypothetical protein